MKRLFYHLFKWASAIICLPIIASSCMREGDDCNATVTARFSYTFNPSQKDLFNDEVDDLLLYIFDQNQLLVTTIFIDARQLQNDNQYKLELPPGQYQFIALANIHNSSYQIQNTADTRAAALSLVTDHNGEINGSLTDLFYGAASCSTQLGDHISVEIPMVKNSKNIKVLLPLEGRTRNIPQTHISVRISADNGAIDFDNNNLHSPTIYKPVYYDTQLDAQQYDVAQFKIIKPQIGDHTHIIISAYGNVQQKDNLVQLLLEHFPQLQSDLDLLKYSDYEFIYRYELGWPVLAEIKAGPWSKKLGQNAGI